MKLLLAVLPMLAVLASATESEKYQPPEAEDDSHLLAERAHVHVTCGPGLFRCNSRFGHCIQEEWVCDTEPDCYDGTDERNCPRNCSGEHQFHCNNGRCKPTEYRCDGNNDCGDHSDELNCNHVQCPAGEVQCDNYLCVEKTDLCDGRDDCGTGWDEHNCVASCSPSQFLCKDGSKCIDRHRMCDGRVDCLDQTDETGCQCQINQFKCQSGRCIPEKRECDGRNDCGDYSDEHNCGTLHPTLCQDVLVARDCAKMNESAHPICLDSDDGFKLCRKFCGLCMHA